MEHPCNLQVLTESRNTKFSASGFESRCYLLWSCQTLGNFSSIILAFFFFNSKMKSKEWFLYLQWELNGIMHACTKDPCGLCQRVFRCSFVLCVLEEAWEREDQWACLGLDLQKNEGGSSGKEPAYQCRRQKRHKFPELGRFPAGGHSCLENPMDRGAWWATVHRVAKRWTWLKWLSAQH